MVRICRKVEIMGEPSSQDPRRWISTLFWIITMPKKIWTPKRSSKPRDNRGIRCAWPSCSFSTTDEKRQGSTNYMLQICILYIVLSKKISFFWGEIQVGYKRMSKPYSLDKRNTLSFHKFRGNRSIGV